MKFTEDDNMPGKGIMINFEKAFDTLSLHIFLEMPCYFVLVLC
jgi:hypothetical protein